MRNVSNQEAIEAVPAVTGRRYANAALIPTVEDNLVFALDDVCFAKFGPRDRTLKEAVAYSAAVKADVPVPSLIAHGELDGRSFLVLEAADGAPVSSLPAPLRTRAERELGSALRSLHTITATGWGSPDA